VTEPARHDWRRAALGMGAVTALSRAFGFVRVLVIAAVLGTTFLGNTFQGANSVSNVLFELLAAGALSAVLVPTFVGLLERGEEGEADDLASRLLGVALLLLGAISVLGIIGAPVIARILSSGVEDPQVAAEQRSLARFLLLFFVPQVMLYAWGAVATALLYARRRFALTAAAPIGNTVVMVAALLAFRVAVGPDPTFDLTTGEKLLLVVAGTGGVCAFVGILVAGARQSGFSLWPRWPTRDPKFTRLLRLTGWGVLLNANAGLLLGAAIILGGAVAGGVVAYQVAWVFFLAPYAILAQPILTAIQPELSVDVDRGNLDSFATTTRQALDRMALLVIPVSAAMVALALPAMQIVAFGRAQDSGPELLAAGLASLALGLYPYGAFMLLARAYYSLHDSRTPALAAIASAVVGIVVMIALAVPAHGAARVAALGIGHSAAYVVGAAVLAATLGRRVQHVVLPKLVPIAVAGSAVLALLAWSAMRALDPDGRVATMLALAGVLAVAGAIYLVTLRRVLRAPVALGAGA
jgi:putative peptidoglycan lipid II flippase